MLVLRAIIVSQVAFFSLAPIALADDKRLEFRSWREVNAYFEEIGYTPEAWRRGERWVPRIELSHMPERWRKVTVKEIDVKTKKRLFFRNRPVNPLCLSALVWLS